MNISKKFSAFLNGNTGNFLLAQVFFNAMIGVMNIFVNTFLLRAFGSGSAEIFRYNIVLAVVQPLAMLTSFFISSRFGYVCTQIVGFVFYGIVSLALCVFEGEIAFLYPLFGVILSFGAGYYYAVYSVEMLQLTRDDNRDVFMGTVSLIGSVLSLLLPLLSGAIVSFAGAEIGYKIVFGLEALLAAAALFFTTRLRKLGKGGSVRKFGAVLAAVMKDKNGRRIMIANGLDNCRGFTVGVYVTILIAGMIEKNEFLTGLNSSIGTAMGILSAFLYGILIHRKNRYTSALTASLLGLTACVCLWIRLDVVTLMVFSAVYASTNIFISTPVLNTHFRVMDYLGVRNLGAEVHTARELFVSAGRILGVFVAWFIPKTAFGTVFVLFLLLLTNLVNARIIHTVDRSLPAEADEGRVPSDS